MRLYRFGQVTWIRGQTVGIIAHALAVELTRYEI